MSSFHKKASLSGIVLLCAALSSPALAVEYSVRAIVDQTAFYDSNLPMYPDQPSNNEDIQNLQDEREQYVSGYDLAPQLILRARSQQWDIKLKTILSFSRLSDQLYDSDDQLMDLEFSHSGDRTRWDVSASIDRDSTRSTVDELGSILAATRVENYSFGPRWTRTLSERNRIAMGGSWSKVNYAEGRFSDYDYYSVDTTWLRQLTEQNQLQLSAYYSVFESGEETLSQPNETHRESDTVGLIVSLNRTVNEALSTNFSIGGRQVDTTSRIFACTLIIFGNCLGPQQATVKDDSDGLTAGAGIDYKAQAWKVSASVNRSLVPNGSVGELLETDTLRVDFTRQLKPTLFFDFVGQWTSEEEIETSAYKRDRVRIEPRVRWRFAERWSLLSSLRYRSRDQQRPGFDNDADGTSISFRVRYEHPRTQWSR